jgi:glutamate-1-semialdehyde 2,1-aminomutase
MMTMFFQQGAGWPVVDWPTAARSDTKAYGRFFWGMIDRGVYLPCSQYEALFISAAHTDADIDATVAAAHAALAGA